MKQLIVRREDWAWLLWDGQVIHYESPAMKRNWKVAEHKRRNGLLYVQRTWDGWSHWDVYAGNVCIDRVRNVV